MIINEYMQSQFDDNLKRLLADFKGNKILLAVSGGVDSIVMANLFLHTSLNVEFEVAHCNFQLRGDDSYSDELFVANWCAHNKVKLHRVTFETEKYAQENELSIEMAARDLRYKWFDELCNTGFSAVAIAHNANDNAETLFLNLLRGTGIKGLCGIREKALLPVAGSKNCLIRPILMFSREEIEDYAMQNGILYCIDSTNSETEFKRNKLRNLVFPLLEEINPSFLETLNEDIKRFEQIDEVADAYFAEHSQGLIQKDGEVIKLSINALLKEEKKDYILFRALENFGFNASTSESILDLITGEGTLSGKTFYSNTHRLITTSDELLIVENENNEVQLPLNNKLQGFPMKIDESETCMVVRGEGLYEFNGRRFHVMLMNRPSDLKLKQPEGVIMWDYDKLSFPFLIRKWNSGDWFCPLGLKGRKKLSDLFTDLKMNLLDKENAVVAVKEADHIASVLCLRLDESLKITPKTSKILIIKEDR